MDLKIGETYIAYRSDNPLKNFKFKVTKTDDFFFDAKILEGLTAIDLWKPYTVRFNDESGKHGFLECSPYYIREKEREARFLIMGYILERRKFIRFKVEELNIKVKSKLFEGIVEDISLGGVKVKILHQKGKIPLREPIYVETQIGDRKFSFIFTPVRIGKNFVAGTMDKPQKEVSEFFYQTLKLLKKEASPVEERRKFRRFYVEPFNIIVDTPLGMGILYDISLGGMKVKLKKTYDVDEEILKDSFAVSCFLPSKNEEYILDCQLLNKSEEGFIQLKVARWDEQALKLISRVLELIVENKKV